MARNCCAEGYVGQASVNATEIMTIQHPYIELVCAFSALALAVCTMAD